MPAPARGERIFARVATLGVGPVTAIRSAAVAIHASLNPMSDIEARIINEQLDRVGSGMRLFNYLLPLAGAIIAFGHSRVSADAATIWWPLLILNCVANEYFLRRLAGKRRDVIGHARLRARSVAAMAFVQLMLWSTISIYLWQPGLDHRLNHMFVDFILISTLATACVMLAFHAATLAGPVIVLSSVVVLGPALNDFQNNFVLFAITSIFVALMVGQACILHERVGRILRLQVDRDTLISDLRKAKDESDHARQHAVNASRAKSVFLANMSHELRTPLNAIIGFSEIVRSKSLGDATGKYAEYGEFIHTSGLRLLDLITNILDLAKIEAGENVLRLAPIDIAGLVAESVAGMTSKAQDRGVGITTRLPDSPPLLVADRRAVRRILDNLLSNAVRFTPPSGSVELSLAVNANGEIVLSVSDNGVGIILEDQVNLFDRFGRHRADIAPENHGVGLGLPIVKGLVDMHGGRLNLESERGQGTRVTIVFPSSSTVLPSDRHVV